MQATWPRSTALDDAWIEIRSSRGRLLCRLDAERLLLEVKPKGGAVELVDLRPYLAGITNSEAEAGQESGEEGNNLIDAAGA